MMARSGHVIVVKRGPPNLFALIVRVHCPTVRAGTVHVEHHAQGGFARCEKIRRPFSGTVCAEDVPYCNKRQYYNRICHGLINHNKYNNNYSYQYAVMGMNKIEHVNFGNLLLTEKKDLSSPIGVLHFEYYDNLDNVMRPSSP